MVGHGRFIHQVFSIDSSLPLTLLLSSPLAMFGARLTAFVLRCFIQVQPYMQVNQTVLTRAMIWLLKHQRPQGEFIEGGRLIHTEMQGGLDDGPVALTAYVLLAFLEDDTYAVSKKHNVCL